MSDNVDTSSTGLRRSIARLGVFTPLMLFAALAGLLGVGLTLNPREIPSPLIGKPVPETFAIGRDGRIAYKQIGQLTPEILRDKIVPLINELRK